MAERAARVVVHVGKDRCREHASRTCAAPFTERRRTGGRIILFGHFLRRRSYNATCSRLLQVAEALLHMQVRLGMLKADDIPSLQAPPTPAVVGGAIMLGTGAVLPQLVCLKVYAVGQSVNPASVVFGNFRPA